eukprot:8891215-Prorocentrum_lima.AAC.1
MSTALWFGDEASAVSERAKLFASPKRKLVRYLDSNVKYVHFPTDPKEQQRMLTHFYTFLGFQDPSVDRSIKRF